MCSLFYVFLRDAQCRVPENQKDIVARHSAFNSLHNAFSFHFCTSARVLACSAGAPRAACVCHVLCVLWWRISSWRWMGSAVWNSADPLKWLLAATRGRGDLRGTCGQMSHPPHPPRAQQNAHNIYVWCSLQGYGTPISINRLHVSQLLICTQTKAILLTHSAPFPDRKWILRSAQ